MVARVIGRKRRPCRSRCCTENRIVSTASVPPEAAAIGVWLTTFALPLTFTYPYEQTSDLLDGLLFAALAGAAWRNRRGWFVALALLGTANRESAAFAGIVWMTFHGVSESWRVHWREAAFSAAISIGGPATNRLGNDVQSIQRRNGRHERSGIDWLGQVQLESSLQRLLPIFFPRQRGERSGGD